MTIRRPHLALALVLLAPAACTQLAEPTAEEVIARTIAVYRDTPEFLGRVDFSIEFPDGRSESKRMEYGRRNEDAFLALVLPDGTRVLEVVAVGDRILASQFNVGNAHIDAGYRGDLLEAFERIGATQVGLKLPPPLAAAATGEEKHFLDALGFGVLGPVQVSGMSRGAGENGPVYELALQADNGSATVTIHASDHRLLSFAMAVGDPGHQVRGTGTFVELDAAQLEAGFNFDPAGRQAVSDFATLESSAYPLGEEAPEATLEDLLGGKVSLASLRGSVVVLDFWATWCVPCWSALPEIQRLAEWAATAEVPVAVFAVSTQETMPGLEQQRAAVQKFLGGRDLSPPTLLDVDGSFFLAMHTPGLPSTVLIAPDGTLARYHSGLVEGMFETLRGEVLELAN